MENNRRLESNRDFTGFDDEPSDPFEMAPEMQKQFINTKNDKQQLDPFDFDFIPNDC